MNKMRILVTGGTGTIGNALIEGWSDHYDFAVYSRDELKQSQMRRKYPNVKFYLGDVRDERPLTQAFKSFRPDIVIHAAAYKQIDTGERNPDLFFDVNVRGTQVVADACQRFDVWKCMLVSTDKACEPVNAYGMSKSLAERVWLARNSQGQAFYAARYGNVIGSRGSLLDMQEMPPAIRAPASTRFYWFAIDAADFIMQRIQLNSVGGMVFVPRLQSVGLRRLFQVWFGGVPDKEVPLLPGEKVHELMVSRHEWFHEKDEYIEVYFHDAPAYAETNAEYSSHNHQLLKESDIKELLGLYTNV